MGQGTSSAHSPFTFGHLATFLEQEPEWPDHSLLLLKPHLYGLAPKPLLSVLPLSVSLTDRWPSCAQPLRPGTQHGLGRVDSGYGETESRAADGLAADLAYVDHTYYGGATARRGPTEAAPLVVESANRLTLADISLSLKDKTLQDVCLSGKSLASLSPNIGLLTMIRKLDISNNHLASLPDAIGCLQHLQVLSVAHNRLVALPDTLGFLLRLSSLDVSDNQINALTPCIGHLKQLQSLALADNSLTHLPVDIGNLTALTTLDVSRNPLTVLPAEIIHLAYLRQLRLDGCAMAQLPENCGLAHDPPSLRELCARKAIQQCIPKRSLPCHLIDYFATAKRCTSCRGPYLETFVVRRRLIERAEQWVPVEYRLCSAHWTDEDDRILHMFADQPREEHAAPLMTVKSPTLLLLPKPEPRIFSTRQHSAAQQRQQQSCPHSSSSLASYTLPSSSSSSSPFILDSILQTEVDEEAQQRIPSKYWPPQRLKKVMSRNHPGFSALTKLKRPSHS